MNTVWSPRNQLPTLAASLLVAGLFYTGLWVWLETPVVKVSRYTGECLQVVGDGSCNALPARYTEVSL